MSLAREPASYWNRLEKLFYEALDLEPVLRSAFLDQRCGDDPALRREIESLLESSDKSLDFLRERIQQTSEHLSGDAQPAESRVGAYRLVKVLGEGGMGKVYLATRADELYRQKVAIKLMHPGFRPARAMLLRFSTERQILANLNHPNIARLLDGGITSNGLPYLVMEYVDGLAIDEYCRQNRLSVSERLKLFSTVCAAVEYAHKNLVVHRDLKPGNILVTREGVPKLLDFGIAKLLDAESGEPVLTQTAERLMTPDYASPEQMRGGLVTTATDVYALGVLLYELLSGSRPFHLATKSLLEAMRIICEQAPEAPSKKIASDSKLAASHGNLRVNQELDNIVLMAMRKEPGRRYVSVAALSADVQAYLAGYPIQARADTWGYRGRKFVLRHKMAVAGVAIAFLALIAFSIGMGLLARRATRARLAAEQQRLTAEREAQFLASIFNAATPEEAKGREVTARELLDQGAQRIESELASEPEAQATMLNNLGMAYTSLGRYEQARPLLQRAYDLRRRLLGSATVEFAATAQALAIVYKLEAKYDRAEPLLRQALEAREKALGEHSPQVAESLSELGDCLFLENRLADAEASLRRALALEGGKEDSLSAMTEDYLALVVKRKGDFNEQVQLLEESVRIEKRVEGDDSPNYVVSLQNLASAQMDQGNLLAGEATEREALDIWRRLSGNDHPELAYSLNNLGWVLLAKGDWEGAIAPLREALQIRARALGDKHPLFVASLVIWGRAMHAKGDDAEAARFYQRATRILQEASKDDNWIMAQILADLAWFHMDRGDSVGGEHYAEQALSMRRRLGGEDNVDVASSLIDVGIAKESQGHLKDAEPMLRQALSIFREKFPAWHPRVIYAEVRLGEVFMRQRKLDLAEPILRQAERGANSAPFALLPWQVAEAEDALGRCLLALDRRSEGLALLRASAPGVRAIPRRCRFR
jgi:eukaryotic-like serine/threonine-protein kinase